MIREKRGRELRCIIFSLGIFFFRVNEMAQHFNVTKIQFKYTVLVISIYTFALYSINYNMIMR